MLAFNAAIEWVIPANEEVNIWSDSESCFQTLKSFHVKSKRRLGQITHLGKARIGLGWVKAQLGIKGNPTEDTLAKEAPMDGKPVNLPFPKLDSDHCYSVNSGSFPHWHFGIMTGLQNLFDVHRSAKPRSRCNAAVGTHLIFISLLHWIKGGTLNNFRPVTSYCQNPPLFLKYPFSDLFSSKTPVINQIDLKLSSIDKLLVVQFNRRYVSLDFLAKELYVK
ncbi:hypothetical protein AVEN_117332-1 [Araneus ventricosus]|uniref:RNase H type-1 domain-containing protein n=1 Tax=Araneus ventricosus TaxID=182803 RepID=A0A4Y2JIG1_ARAVE|nr:hypothetical protein AVEN_117332-1 [Araneus ventricosus]